jgi:hypothetical protein
LVPYFFYIFFDYNLTQLIKYITPDCASKVVLS